MIDFDAVKLNADHATYLHDDRTLLLSNYLPELSKLPPLPQNYDWNAKAQKSLSQVYGNDTYGDCVVAATGHMIGRWTANAGKEVVFPEKTITDLYFKLTGGADSGLYLLTMLNYWRKHGVGNTAPIGAYLQFNPRSQVEWNYATYLFGGAYLAFDLPLTAKTQIKNNQPWDVVDPSLKGDSEPGSWGGHCIGSGKYASYGRVVDTWGLEQPCTNAFIGTYCSEAYVILTLDWFNAGHKTPLGFDWKTMTADLTAVTNA